MKKNFKTKSKNRKVLESFIEYCIAHPEQRFWQALRNWSGFGNIKVLDLSQNWLGKIDYKDTFYFEGKEK